MEKLYYVYIIECEHDKIRYVGLTEDPKRRLIEHNSKKSKFTKGHSPWKIIFSKLVGSVKDARELEKYYKSAAGRRRILQQFPKD